MNSLMDGAEKIFDEGKIFAIVCYQRKKKVNALKDGQTDTSAAMIKIFYSAT